MTNPMDRKVVQIAAATRLFDPGHSSYVRPTVVALCDDGVMFQLEIGSDDWERLPAIPQD